MIVANVPYDAIEIGQTAELTRVVTHNDLVIFANASGNFNPMHLPDAELVSEETAVAPAMWVGSLFSALLGNQLPGVGTLYRAQHLSFAGRAHVGDTLTITVRVRSKLPHEVVELECRATNQHGALICEGVAEVTAPTQTLTVDASAVPTLSVRRHAHFDKLLARCAGLPPLPTAVAAPEDENSLGGALLAAERGLITPILVGDAARIRAVAEKLGRDLGSAEIIDVAGHGAAAARAVALVHEGRARAVLKGHIHSDELLAHVVKRDGGLRAGRRLSHVFVMDVPGVDNLLFVSDAAINIAPDLETKIDITQNAIDLAIALGIEQPRVGILSAIETVSPKMQSSIDAAIISKMAERGQIRGGLVDGPLAMDNAIDLDAARTKGIKSLVAGRAEVLIVPNIEAGNMLAKELTFVAHAEAAGLVMGAKVPVMLTSRADDEKARLVSCALAVLHESAKG